MTTTITLNGQEHTIDHATLDGLMLKIRKLKLSERIAERRWEIETGGVAVGGTTFKTDRESQSLLLGAIIMLPDGMEVQWKTKDGFVTRSKIQLQQAAGAVLMHVQSCFTRESQLQAALEATADADLDAFTATVEAFWPTS